MVFALISSGSAGAFDLAFRHHWRTVGHRRQNEFEGAIPINRTARIAPFAEHFLRHPGYLHAPLSGLVPTSLAASRSDPRSVKLSFLGRRRGIVQCGDLLFVVRLLGTTGIAAQ